MEKTQAYFIDSEYDDLYKFNWPVLIEKDSLCLWLDVNVLKTHFNNFPDSVGKPITEFDIVKYIGDNVNTQNKNYWFVTLKDLKNIKFIDTLLNINFELLLNQFILTQLPQFVNQHLNSLSLISLYDIKDFWEELKILEHYKKYWLFRYKIVVMRFENEKKLRNQQQEVSNNLTANKLEIQDVCSKSDVELEPKKFLKKVEEGEFDIKNSKIKQEHLQVSNKTEIKGPSSSTNFINTLSFTELNLINNLMTNIETQFIGLKEYKPEVRLHTTSSFLTLLKGTVGLLEHLLIWS